MTPTTELTPDSEQSPSPEVQPRFGENNRKLPQQIQNALRAATVKSQTQERYLRRLEVLRDRRNRFYERGHQHMYEGYGDTGWLAAIPGGVWTDANGNENEWGPYIGDYNLIHGFIWILQSVLTQTPTGIDFDPIDPSKSEDTQAAETADGLRRHFNRVNDTRALARETVRMMCVSGRFTRWVQTVENFAKYGRGKQRVCQVFGSLETKVPLMEKCQTTFPYLIIYKDMDIRNAKQNYPWIRTKIHAGENCLDENNYEKFARLGVLQGARTEFQAGESIAHLITEGNVWLRPSCFSDTEFDDPFEEATEEDLIEEEDEFGGITKRTPTVREIIESTYSDENTPFEGVHAVFVGKTYAESWAESMDDCLTTDAPFAGDGQDRKAIIDDAIEPQDKFNDQMNYVAECFDFGAPREYTAATGTEYAAMVDQRAEPWGLTQVKLNPNVTSVQDMVYRTPNPEIPATMQAYIEFLMGEFMEFILACPPSLWGEVSDANKTATGQQLATNQSKGRLGLIWAVLQNADAEMYRQVALAAANDPDTPEEIVVPVKDGQNITLRPERLRKGHFMAKPDEDSGFPDSTNQVRAVLQQVLTLLTELAPADPQLLQQFMNPTNLKEIMRTYGLSNFVLPEAEASEKQLEEIEELLNGVPVEPTPEEIEGMVQQSAQAQQQYQMAMQAAEPAVQQAQLMGQPVPPPPPPPEPFDPEMAVSDWTASPPRIGTMTRSSVPINPWDFDQWHKDKCDEWLNGDACRIEIQIGRADPETGETVSNIRGVMNVWLHDQEHMKAIAAKTPPAPPMPVQMPHRGTPAKPKAPGTPAGVPKPPNPLQSSGLSSVA